MIIDERLREHGGGGRAEELLWSVIQEAPKEICRQVLGFPAHTQFSPYQYCHLASCLRGHSAVLRGHQTLLSKEVKQYSILSEHQHHRPFVPSDVSVGSKLSPAVAVAQPECQAHPSSEVVFI